MTSFTLFFFHFNDSQAIYYVGLGFWIALLDLLTGHHWTLDSIFKYQVK